MKQIFTLLLFLTWCINPTQAQLADGAIAPDFTAVDLDGNSYTLYDMLDEGKTVILDFSATWCGPCWSYHQSGVLETLHELYGPDGTDELRVFMIEGDDSTNLDCLYDLPGCNSSTLGNWVDGTHYPIINDDVLAGPYSIAYWPTLYQVCPSRTITEVGQPSVDDFYASIGSCPQKFGDNNISTLGYDGFSGEFCTSQVVSPEFDFQNFGALNVTSATFVLNVNGVDIQTIDWSGDLITYAIETVVFDEITISEDTDFAFSVTSVNGTVDDDDTNNQESFTTSLIAPSDDNNLTLELQTDTYGVETYWEIIRDDGTAFYSGGNAAVVGGADNSGAYIGNEFYRISIPVPTDGCYSFNMYDSYGDGICCDYGDGYYKLIDANGVTIMEGGDFETEDFKPFGIEGGEDIVDNGSIASYLGEQGAICGDSEIVPSVLFQNLGANDIGSVAFEVLIGGEYYSSFDWTGSIESAAYEVIDFDAIPVSGISTIDINVVSVNGSVDENEYKNSVSFAVEGYETRETEWVMELQLDSYSYETYWQITNSAGDVMASGGNELVGPDGGGSVPATIDDPGAYLAADLITEMISLPADVNDCYDFLLVDSYGDGFVDGGGGYVRMTSEDGSIFSKDLTELAFTSLNLLTDVEAVSSIKTLSTVQDFKVFPNPASDKVNINFQLTQSEDLRISLLNALGQELPILSKTNYGVGTQQLDFDVSTIENGMYIIQIDNGKAIANKKITILK